MYNITSDEYKKAIKAKYEIEKSGDYSNFLMSPTQASLRKLCWERFKENSNTDDLNTFQTFFDFEFSINKKNQLKEQTDKLRPIRAFLIGKTEYPTDETIDFAAILVDFEFRPYRKFEKKATTKIEQTTHNSFDSEKVNKDGEIEIKDYFENEDENCVPEIEEKANSPLQTNFFERLFNRSKLAIVAVTIIFCLIAATIYLAFIKKNCMQWSEDHYEIVDCNSNPEQALHSIIPLNKDLLDFRKIKVYDTTTCFNKNGDAFIWYSKSNNIVEFFNTHGRHPENNKPLRPVTDYIKKRYGEKSVSKK